MPYFGRMAAMLSEAVIILIAMIVAARWVIRRFRVPRTLPATISMGLVALGLLLPAEIAGALWLRRLSFQEYVASFATASGVISLIMFLLFVVMPTLVGRLTAAVWQHNDSGEVEDLWETDYWDAGHPYGIDCGFGVVSHGGLSISVSPTRDGIAEQSAGGIAGTRAPKKLMAATTAE